jgi:cyclopropane-fatty-acyl-phospholipid synthase
LRKGRLDIVLPDGRRFRAEGASPGQVTEIAVHDPDVFARLVREGELGFTEAYMEGAWSTPDLQAFMDLLNDEADEIYDSFRGARLVRAYERLRFWLQGNSKRQARRNISHHDDLGNDFSALWLDETMTYSSELFDGGQQSLEAAQRRKYESLVDRMGAQPGQHVLEIGCGWGGFAEYAAGTRGAAGHRAHHFEGAARLRPGAHPAGGHRSSVDFIQRHIFPGGMLPSPGVLRAEVERAGLRVLDSIEFGDSYSRILRLWRQAFDARWAEVAAPGFDERFRRMWDMYLTSCAAAFHAGSCGVTQITVERPAA